MTGFRLLSCFCLLLLGSSVAFAVTEPGSAQTVSQLRQENVSLQRQVKRLEAQVTAMREEMNAPDVTQIVGGIGYIVGIFGIVGWIAARKKSGGGD